MRKERKKISLCGLLILSVGVLATTLTTNLNFNIIKNQKNIEKKFVSIDSNYFRWPNEGQSVQTEINGVMSTIYTPLAADYNITNNTLHGLKDSFVNDLAGKNVYLNVKIPANITGIDTGAFTSVESIMNNQQQNKIKSAEVNNKILRVDFALSSNLTSINDNAFNGLKNLQIVNFDDMVTYHVSSLGASIFENCTSLRKMVNFEKFNTYQISRNMFKNNKKLEYIKLSSDIKYIYSYAFAGTNLSTADLSNTNLQWIGEGAYYNSNIKAAYVPDGVKIQKNAFYKDGQKLSAYKVSMETKNYNANTLRDIGLDPTVPTVKETHLYLNKNKFDNDFRYGLYWTVDSFNSLTMSEKAKYFILAGPEQKTLPKEALFRTLTMDSKGIFRMTIAHPYSHFFFVDTMPPKETVFQCSNQVPTDTLIQEKDFIKIEAELEKEVDLWNRDVSSRENINNFKFLKRVFNFKIENAWPESKIEIVSLGKVSSSDLVRATLKLTDAVVNGESGQTITVSSEIKILSGLEFTTDLANNQLFGYKNSVQFNKDLNAEIDLFNQKIQNNQIDHSKPFVDFEILNSLKLNITNFNKNIRLKRTDKSNANETYEIFTIEASINPSIYLPNEVSQVISSKTFMAEFVKEPTPEPTPPPVEPDPQPNPDNNGGSETTPPVDPQPEQPKPPVDNGGGETTPPNPGPDAGGDKPTPPNPDKPQPEEDPNAEIIKNNDSISLGTAIGAVIFLALLAAIIVLILKKSKRK